MTKPISQYSAAMIGIHDSANSRFQPFREKFKEEAKVIADHIQGIHHARKLPSMQVNYSNTVEKLNNYQLESTLRNRTINTINDNNNNNMTTNNNNYNTSNSNYNSTSNSTYNNSSYKKITKEKEFFDSFTSAIKSEGFINERKRLYNKETSRKAIVHEIIKGTAPMPKHLLYPQKATHDQILAMTGARTAPDANRIPPPVTKTKRWLGDATGWEN